MRWQQAWRRAARRMPAPLRLALAHSVIGFGLAGAAVLAILLADFNGLGTLMLRAPEHPLPALLLWFFLGTGFSSVQIGIAVMGLGAERPGGPSGARLREAPPPVPVRARRG